MWSLAIPIGERLIFFPSGLIKSERKEKKSTHTHTPYNNAYVRLVKLNGLATSSSRKDCAGTLAHIFFLVNLLIWFSVFSLDCCYRCFCCLLFGVFIVYFRIASRLCLLCFTYIRALAHILFSFFSLSFASSTCLILIISWLTWDTHATLTSKHLDRLSEYMVKWATL